MVEADVPTDTGLHRHHASHQRSSDPAAIARRVRRLYLRLTAAPDLRPGPHVDPLLHRLVELVVTSPSEHAATVLADPHVRALQPHLVSLCAQAEHELELAWATQVAASHTPRATLRGFPYLDNYRQLSRLERAALNRCTSRPPRGVLFVGSGPLPLSSLHLARLLDAPIDNLDRDATAIRVARQVAHKLGARHLTFRHGTLAAQHDLARYDLVILAALAGITLADKSHNLRHLHSAMAPGALLLARSAHGLKRLLYPAVDPARVHGFDVQSVTHPTGPVLNSILLARKPEEEGVSRSR